MIERPIIIRMAGSDESFEFNPPDDLWVSMLAFCEVKGITIRELILTALEDWARNHPPIDGREPPA
jgi:hypothetical protein